MRLGRRPRTIGLIAIAALVAAVIFHKEILSAIGEWLIVTDGLRPATVIHVIAGEEHRARHAIELYKRGFGDKLFFTGTVCDHHHVHLGEYSKQMALQEDIPAENIVLDDSPIKSTYDEAVLLRRFLDRIGAGPFFVIVVTDPHHTRRARWAYRRVMGANVTVLMAPVPFENTPYKPEWWTDWGTRRMVQEEYLKFAYYIARYQLSSGWVQQYLASLDRK